MKRTIFAFASLVTLGVPAYAAEGKVSAPASGEASCLTIDGIKADATKNNKKSPLKFMTLNVGQFHAAEGAWAVVPPIVGLPPADGAILATTKDGNGILMWTKGGCIAEVRPTPIPSKFVAILKSINPGVGEKADSPEDTSGDLSL